MVNSGDGSVVLQGQENPIRTALDLLSKDLATSLQRGVSVTSDRASPVFAGGLPKKMRTAVEVVSDEINLNHVSNSGYVVDTAGNALYDLWTAESAEQAVVEAVNRSGDTDIIRAIAGAIVGARFGASALPKRWLNEIDKRDELEQIATALAAHPHGERSDSEFLERGYDGI